MPSKQEVRQQIACDTRQFLRDGHRIHKLPEFVEKPSKPIKVPDYDRSDMLLVIYRGANA